MADENPNVSEKDFGRPTPGVKYQLKIGESLKAETIDSTDTIRLRLSAPDQVDNKSVTTSHQDVTDIRDIVCVDESSLTSNTWQGVQEEDCSFSDDEYAMSFDDENRTVTLHLISKPQKESTSASSCDRRAESTRSDKGRKD